SGAILALTCSTACRTPRPPYLSSLSRSSTASYFPVDAPEGTPERPQYRSPARSSTSTVGFPLESRISLAYTSVIGRYLYIFSILLTHLLCADFKILMQIITMLN